MGFRKILLKVLSVEERESARVFLLLGMGFTMGIFLATLDVGAAALFLKAYDPETDLPLAILLAGIFGVVTTALYNFFQNRIPFSRLAISSLILITIVLLGVEIAFRNLPDPAPIYFFAFTFIVPANFIVLLVFWGAFGRMFNLRQAKRIIGSIDTGQLVASIIALFSIPIILNYVETQDLLFISLLSVAGYLVMFFLISHRKLFVIGTRHKNKSVSYRSIIQNKYIALMALFVIISMIAVNFVDYSFLNVTTARFDEDSLATFLSLFEGTVVIFSFLFQTFVTDKIIAIYGLKISLLVNPLLIALFTAIAIPVGYAFGYTENDETIIYFFIMIAMSKLFIASLKDALDGPAFKLYFLPIDATTKFDIQTKIEGVITAFAGLVAGGLIILINNVQLFTLIHVSIFTLPALALWYFVTTRMHNNYRQTLRSTLVKNKKEADQTIEQKYALNHVLETEINSNTDNKVIYGLKLMEKLEPALFESAILKLVDSESRNVQNYVKEKLKTLDIDIQANTETRHLAKLALQESQDSEIISVSPEKLAKLTRSIKSDDRILAAKLLRKLVNDKNIFVLLELLRDIDPTVKKEAIITARKVSRPETWTILIELLNSPSYCNEAAAALVESGEAGLFSLESAFHKSGQTDQVMLKIVQIVGRIGGDKAIELLWNKIEYPDKRIVRQILLSFRYFNYHAREKEVVNMTNLLENEISKTIWNLAALTEIPDDVKYFNYLREAIREEVKSNFDTIYIILAIMYDPQSVQLVRENVESGTTDGIAFAIELLDLFLDQELKPKLFPLLDDIPVTEKVRQLQIHFPRENYTLIQTLNYLLNKNYNQTNRWTKACTIHCLAYLSEFRISRGLIAQLFNSDELLQEAAAWVIYHKDKQTFNRVADRLKPEIRRFLEDSIEKNRLQEGLKDGFFLRLEMVMFLKTISIFKDIKGVLLCDLVDKMKNINLIAGGSLPISGITDDEEQIFIVADGEVLIKDQNVDIMRLKTGEVFGSIFNMENLKATTVEAFGNSVVFYLSVFDFYNVMANHHELAQGFINNINKQPKAEAE